MTKGRHPIRVVSRLTGLGIDTLRAWERRYGVVAPARSRRANETRLYSDAEVARLQRLARGVAAGHRIGHLAGLSDGALARTLEPLMHAATPGPARQTARRHAQAIVTSPLESALARLDTAALDREFARLAAALPPHELVRDVLLPSLRDAGNTWMKRRGGVALEHVLSSTLRGLLSSFLRIYARSSAGVRLLFTTLEGDRHELGILSGAMLAASSGLGISYVGPDLPAADIVTAVKTSGARVLVLGMTFSDDEAQTAAVMDTLGRSLPKNVEMWTGGRIAQRFSGRGARRALVLNDFDSFIAQLARLGGRKQ